MPNISKRKHKKINNMLAIKYLAKKEGSWLYRQMNKKCKTEFGTIIQMYVFNDFISTLVHIGFTLIFGILANFVNESLMVDLMLYIGIVPMMLTTLPYIIAGLIINPIIYCIKKWRK